MIEAKSPGWKQVQVLPGGGKRVLMRHGLRLGAEAEQ